MCYTVTLEHASEYSGCETLSEKIANIFDFHYDMPNEYKCHFEYLFFKKYSYYQIGFETFAMFKHELEVRLLEVLPRYLKLYASENVVQNPFVTHAMKNENWSRDREKQKGYNVNNHKAINENQDNSVSVNNDISSVDNKSIDLSFDRNDSINKTKSLNDTKTGQYNRNTDTPQSRGVSNFNDDYMTNATRIDGRGRKLDSTTNETWSENANEKTNDSNTSSNSFGSTANERQSLNESQQYSDGFVYNGREHTNKNYADSYGFTGITASGILSEWRETFINIDKMLLNEFRDLFLMIYN